MWSNTIGFKYSCVVTLLLIMLQQKKYKWNIVFLLIIIVVVVVVAARLSVVIAWMPASNSKICDQHTIATGNSFYWDLACKKKKERKNKIRKKTKQNKTKQIVMVVKTTMKTQNKLKTFNEKLLKFQFHILLVGINQQQ